MKKMFRKIHLWLSVPFGIIITLVCFSGAMLVFETEITEAIQHDTYFVSNTGRPLPMSTLMEKAAATLPDSVKATGITAFSDPERAWQVSLSKPRRASLYINQYTGEITGRTERLPFFATMFSLHRWLMDSMKPGDDGIRWGKMIVGTATLLFIIIAITGIIIWWPRNKKGLKAGLTINVRNGRHRFFRDLHIAGGIYTLLLLLIMALTGLTWSFGWYRTAFYGLFGATQQTEKVGNDKQEKEKTERGEQRAEEGRQRSKDGRERSEEGRQHAKEGRQHSKEGKPSKHREKIFAQWDKVYAQLLKTNHDYRKISISDGKASISRNSLGNQRAADNYTFDRTNGLITGSTPYAKAEKAQQLRGWIFAVHTGSFGGLITELLWFIAALLGATLPLTGYYLWIRRLRKKQK